MESGAGYSVSRVESYITAAKLKDNDGDGFLEYKSGEEYVPFTLRFIVCTDSGKKVHAAQLIADSLKDMGFNVELTKLDVYKRQIADRIMGMEEEYKALSDEALKAKTGEFKERLQKGETLDDILPEAFAAVREAAARVLGMRPYRVQLIGGIVLHQGRIAEMKTGEGKTLVAVLPSYLNALAGKGVHVVTVNDLSLIHILPPKYSFVKIALSFEERSDLYRRIDLRVDAMMEKGLLSEMCIRDSYYIACEHDIRHIPAGKVHFFKVFFGGVHPVHGL